MWVSPTREPTHLRHMRSMTQAMRADTRPVQHRRWQMTRGRCGWTAGVGRGKARLRSRRHSPPRPYQAPMGDRGHRPLRCRVPDPQDDEEQCCVVCLANPKSHAFVPCGHRCVCGVCSQEILHKGVRDGASCPVCRAPATGALHIFT
mmetsp:Transcript_53068/g.153013  ORF Transcript_53068/g.153013 Transcript_53068/m.153013 type:complete len:147 (+) Transcript_53068:1177-1617(+)